jgi:hypothetical protein
VRRLNMSLEKRSGNHEDGEQLEGARGKVLRGGEILRWHGLADLWAGLMVLDLEATDLPQ